MGPGQEPCDQFRSREGEIEFGDESFAEDLGRAPPHLEVTHGGAGQPSRPELTGRQRTVTEDLGERTEFDDHAAQVEDDHRDLMVAPALLVSWLGSGHRAAR